MKRKRFNLLFFIMFIVVLFLQPSDDIEIMDLVDKVAQRLDLLPKLNQWQASVISTSYQMDKNWQPKKQTVIEKVVTVKGDMRTEEISKATETEKGKSRNVTEKYKEKARKEAEKARNQVAEGKQPVQGDSGGSYELTQKEIFPFDADQRVNYDFRRLDDTSLDGEPVYAIEVRAKIAKKDYFEGTYYIRQGTFDVLRVELRPAEYAGPLKLLEMVFDFQVLPEGYYFQKEAKFRIHVGLVVKNIRMEVQERYFDIHILQ